MSEALREAWRAGQAAWPGVHVTEEELATYLAARTTRTDGVEGEAAERGAEALPRNAKDLYLACACVRADPAALAAFDAAFTGEIRATVARVASRALSEDEVRQLVHHRLLVAEEGEPPRIAEYQGRGELRTWVQMIAIRLALNESIRAARQIPFETDALSLLVGAAEDTELAYFKRVYTGEFRAAFASAFREMSPRERNLLRHAFREGLTVDVIGALYNVHRATAARWISKAHAQLAGNVRRELRVRLGVDDEELVSILRIVRSRLDITLERYLDEPAAPEAKVSS